MKQQDLNITITDIELTNKHLFKIHALAMYGRGEKRQFTFTISRDINEELVNKLVVGESYNIKQECLERNGHTNYHWLSATKIAPTKKPK